MIKAAPMIDNTQIFLSLMMAVNQLVYVDRDT